MTGIDPAIAREAYDRLDRVNFSTLKHMARSARHYAHWLGAKLPDSESRKFGRTVHLAVLEPDRFAASVAIWDGGTRRGKAWDAFCAEHVGKELLTEEEHRGCMLIAEAVRQDGIAAPYIARGFGEVAVLWDHGAHKCKARIDFDGEHLVDLKTCRDASPENFQRDSYRYKYHVQAAFYSDGYLLATGQSKPFVIIAAESEPPYLVQVYRVPPDVIEAGRREYQLWLDRLTYCKEQRSWPGYATGELLLSLPSWVENEIAE